jgi:hypothetical protein
MLFRRRFQHAQTFGQNFLANAVTRNNRNPILFCLSAHVDFLHGFGTGRATVRRVEATGRLRKLPSDVMWTQPGRRSTLQRNHGVNYPVPPGPYHVPKPVSLAGAASPARIESETANQPGQRADPKEKEIKT